MNALNRMDFDAFFEKATAAARSDSTPPRGDRAAPGFSPYDFQRRLACGEQEDGETRENWLSGATNCRSKLISIPTGLGKTAAVILAWLWNRVVLNGSDWPRRLVYCLPMRTLVEQTENSARSWLANLQDYAADHGFLDRLPDVHILMGGEEKTDWDIFPEKNAILIGTQDMLLSRALNRGYGMSRYRWPMHFGLLNNDCLWVMDETQLMGPGLSTACQLEAFRQGQARGFGSVGEAGSVTWYMSATNNPEHLKTREWRDIPRPTREFDFSMSSEEKSATTGPVHQRRHAVKRLELQPDSGFVDSTALSTLVAVIVTRHEEMIEAIASEPKLPARTLIICNTVDRAVKLHELLASEKPDGCDLLLLHSRFRPPERRAQLKQLKTIDGTAFPKGQIVISTQVVEAGVDISSGILWSEVAPLASLVQRFGRLNRAGEFNDSPWKPLAGVIGVGVEEATPRENKETREKREKDNTGRCLPYELSACKATWISLEKLQGDASPANLEQIQADVAASIPRCPYSLQRHELTDFFDSDANLSLGFTDVSPFVRGLDDDTDLQVLWRESWLQKNGDEGTSEPGFTPDFQRDELCSVPMSKARVAREVLNHGWLWRGKEAGWLSMRDLDPAPGMTILLPLIAGGYDTDAGWTGDKTNNKHSSHYQTREMPSDEDQLSSLANGWRSIAAHTGDVAHELNEILRDLLAANDNETERASILGAVSWHDVGKNHDGWQKCVRDALKEAGIAGKDAHRPFAKFSLSDSPSLRDLEGEVFKKRIRELRSSFRPSIAHEVASALAFRASEQARLGPDRDANLASLLAEYVIMSHHGRVRKVLRDEIPRYPKDEKDTNTVRGISEGDKLPAVEIDGQDLGCTALSTDCRQMGRDSKGHESYTRGVLRLLEHYGPFRLAFFEAIFRAADIRASILAKNSFQPDTSPDDLGRKHPELAIPSIGAQVAHPMGEHSPGRGGEHGVREGAGRGRDDSRDTRPGRATRFVETTLGILSYTELAPLLAERVAKLEAAIFSGAFAEHPLDEELLLSFHRQICEDFVPSWAGRWRDVAVTVGRLEPPPPHALPVLMRNYTLDLQARWQDASASLSELTLEFLAFAEGRFLTIHPFKDFNGRTIRVILLELLRRLDLPRVELAPQTEPGRDRYFTALESADQGNLQPLIAIWKDRFTPIS